MALYLRKELDNNAIVAVWQITETEAELRELSSTPSDEMEEISFIKSESLRNRTRNMLGASVLAWGVKEYSLFK